MKNVALKASLLRLFLVVGVASLFVVGCKSSEDEPEKEVTLPKFDENKPSVPIAITSSGITIASEVDSPDGECLENYGVYWSTTNQQPTAADNKVELGRYCGPFPVSFENEIRLAASVARITEGSPVYYIRPFARIGQTTTYGATQQVIPSGQPPVFPNVPGIPEIPVTTATETTFSNFIEATGGSPIIQHGFVYTDNILMPGPGLPVERLPIIGADPVLQLGAYKGTFPGKFSGKITGLKPGSIYTVRGYAINASGVSYGKAMGIQTP
jgi:hypothetical protein